MKPLSPSRRLAGVLLHILLLAAAAAQPPDIIYIMSDDMGYSDLGCYGGEIETPHLDRLAARGLRFSQFYNTGRCCPTRASLLTGLYPHQTGVGHMMSDRGHDGYRGDLNRQCVTLPEVLQAAGYRSYVTGKWHVTRHDRAQTEKDKHNWPLQRGFDRFYGTLRGGGSFFDPATLVRGNRFISPAADPDYTPEQYYFTDAVTDHATRFIREHHEDSPDTPFFLYVSYTAPHWPLHARPQDIQKYQGRYDAGYDAIRAARYENLVQLGLVTRQSTALPPVPDAAKETQHWDWDRRNMEVYAAMVDRMDQGIGQILDTLGQTRRLDNTLILFLHDNGGSAERHGRRGVGTPRPPAPTLPPLADDHLRAQAAPTQTRDGYPVRSGKGVMAGAADTDVGYGQGWATVSNTPFREYKHWTHEGGIASPLIAHWPARITRHGEIEHTPAHVIDLLPTAAQLAGAPYPTTFHGGQAITPVQGVSLEPLFRGQPVEREALYWEHGGNRAVRAGDYKLVAKRNAPWELYNLATDRSEQHDLSQQMPDRAAQMQQMWEDYAKRSNVLPLNPNRKRRAPNKPPKARKGAP